MTSSTKSLGPLEGQQWTMESMYASGGAESSTRNYASYNSETSDPRSFVVGIRNFEPKKVPRAAVWIKYGEDRPIDLGIEKIEAFLREISLDQVVSFGRAETSHGSFMGAGSITNDKVTGNGKIVTMYAEYNGAVKDGLLWGAGILTTYGATVTGQFERKPHGFCTITFLEKSIVEGICKEGYFQASKAKKFPQNRVYTGEMKNGQFHGRGTYIFGDGRVYEGEWENGKAHGHGKASWPEGSYDGRFKDSKRHGLGILRKASGSIYVMQWIEDISGSIAIRKTGGFVERVNKDGKVSDNLPKLNPHNWDFKANVDGREQRIGYRSYPDGSTYLGEFVNGKRCGVGTMTLPKLGIYRGEWKDDQRNGYGTHTQLDGETFEGFWKENKMHGKVTQRCRNGSKYTCEWVEGKKQGFGSFRLPSGVFLEGWWENDQLHGRGQRESPSGDIYEGDWVRGKRHGKGTYTSALGESYGGDWVEDKMEGIGKKLFSDGSVYQGQWLNDQMHGQGTLTFPDETIQKGIWEHGVFQST